MIDGLRLSLIGMGVVFAVLILLAVSIKIFDRVDSLIPETGTTEIPKLASGRATPALKESDAQEIVGNYDTRAAAAIAVALALAESDRDRPPSGVSGGLAQTSANIWVAAGRTREMASRLSGQSLRTRSGR